MPCFTPMLTMLQHILTVSTSSYPQFTPINAQVQDVTYYLGWLKMQTAAPKAVVATLILLTAGLVHHTQLAGPLKIALHSPHNIMLVYWFVTLCVQLHSAHAPAVFLKFLQQNDECHSDGHTHMHIHTHIHTCTHMYTHTQTHVHIHLHTPSNTCKPICTHTNTIHTHVHTTQPHPSHAHTRSGLPHCDLQYSLLP